MYTKCIKATDPSPYYFIHMKRKITFDVLIMHESLKVVTYLPPLNPILIPDIFVFHKYKDTTQFRQQRKLN